MRFASRQRTAFLMTMADLFLGASAILIILIVLARPSDEKRVPRFVDIELSCIGVSDDGWLLTMEQGDNSWTMPEWFEQQANGALLLRVGLWIRRSEIGCYRAFKNKAKQHNAQLMRRGAVGASVMPILLPFMGDVSVQNRSIKP